MGYKERFRKKYPNFSLNDPLQNFIGCIETDHGSPIPSVGYKVTLSYDDRGHIKDMTFERIN